MKDLNKSLKVFKEYMASDEGKEHANQFFSKIKNKELIEKRHVQLIHERFGSDIDSIIEKVISKYKSKEYKDRWYNRSIEPQEMLYWCLYDYAEFLNQRASIKQIDEYGSEMFGGNVAYIVGSYFFQYISGQGAAIIVEKIK